MSRLPDLIALAFFLGVGWLTYRTLRENPKLIGVYIFTFIVASGIALVKIIWF